MFIIVSSGSIMNIFHLRIQHALLYSAKNSRMETMPVTVQIRDFAVSFLNTEKTDTC